MAWAFNRNNTNQLKRGKLITAQGAEYDFNYEEMKARSYGVQNDIIEGMDYIKAVHTIKTSSEWAYALHDAILTEEGYEGSIKRITPVIENSKSRYSRNQTALIIDLGEW